MATKMRTGRMTVKTTTDDQVRIGKSFSDSKKSGSENIATTDAFAKKQQQDMLLRQGWTPEELGMNRDSLIKTNPNRWGHLAKPAATPSTKKPVSKTVSKPVVKPKSKPKPVVTPTKVVINKQTGKTKVTKR